MPVLDFEVKVPQKLSAIKLNQYQQYLKILKGIEKDSESISNESSEFLNLKSLEIFCGLQLKDSYKLPLSVFDSVLGQLAECFKEQTPRVDRFTMTDAAGKTIEFGLMPNISEMSFGEYYDLDSYVQDWETMHKAMAVLYRPIVLDTKGKYLIEEYEGSSKWSDVMAEMPVNVALGAYVFFYRLGSKLSKHTMNYLLEEALDKGDSTSQLTSEKSGDGISQFMLWQEEMLQGLTRLPSFHYTSA
jgi:hypothetical protein